MGNFFTTRQLQELLQVDRTTIYRMADGGRIPAVKVGNQWRFPKHEVESWLHAQSSDSGPSSNGAHHLNGAKDITPQAVRRLLPVACVQPIQDMLAELLGVMIVVTDLNGRPITRISHPCGLYAAPELAPPLHEVCVALWANLARLPDLTPSWHENALGLHCTRGLIRVAGDLGAMIVIGGVADPTWSPSDADIQAWAERLDVSPALLRQHIHEVYVLDQSQQADVLGYVQRMADIIAHIVNERQVLYDKLENIAALTQI